MLDRHAPYHNDSVFEAEDLGNVYRRIEVWCIVVGHDEGLTRSGCLVVIHDGRFSILSLQVQQIFPSPLSIAFYLDRTVGESTLSSRMYGFGIVYLRIGFGVVLVWGVYAFVELFWSGLLKFASFEEAQ